MSTIDLAKSKQRLLSLDVFRGLTIVGMMLVDCPGNDSVYPALKHAPWNGWTFADLIFPSFLVIMGVSLTISLSRRMARREPHTKIKWQILKRTIIIFAFGLIISLVIFNSPSLRIPGVLQRIALCYCTCAFLFLDTGPFLQLLICAGLLIVYWLMLMKIPVPSHIAGILTPDGNITSYLDRIILGQHRYLTEASDPEGILSTLSAIATTLLGVLGGRLILSREGPWIKAIGLIASGLVATLIGLAWSHYIPMNKHIWTSSYALFTGGVALAGLGFCYALIEGLGIKRWGRPFEIFGHNALLSYFLSGLFYGIQEFITVRLPSGTAGNLKLWICESLFGFWLSPINASLAYSVAYIGLCLGVMNYLYRRNIFLKI